MSIKINTEKCTGCGDCVAVCPNNCLEIDGKNVKVKEDECIDCGLCVPECKKEAISE